MPPKKNVHAVALGRRGGLARDYRRIPPEQRAAYARHAAQCRWAKSRKAAETLVKSGA